MTGPNWTLQDLHERGVALTKATVIAVKPALGARISNKSEWLEEKVRIAAGPAHAASIYCVWKQERMHFWLVPVGNVAISPKPDKLSELLTEA